MVAIVSMGIFSDLHSGCRLLANDKLLFSFRLFTSFMPSYASLLILALFTPVLTQVQVDSVGRHQQSVHIANLLMFPFSIFSTVSRWHVTRICLQVQNLETLSSGFRSLSRGLRAGFCFHLCVQPCCTFSLLCSFPPIFSMKVPLLALVEGLNV
jgi:hypothetical protein